MAFNLKDDPRMLQRLQGAAGLLSTKDIDAPPAELPPLESIDVDLPVAPPPDEVAILGRYRDKLREMAVVTPKKAGDELELGDEVCVSTVGYANGALVPGSIKFQHWMEMVPEPALPGFVEALVGAPIGGATVVPVLLPDDFVDAAFRNKPAAFTVQIHEAQSVSMPHPEDATTVKALGIAATLEETLHKIGLELLAESEESAPLFAMNAAMHALARHAKVELPQKAVDAEIQRVWKSAEGDHAAALGLSVEEQQEALKLWLTNPAVQDEARTRLKNWAALRAVVERDQLTMTEGAWDAFYSTYAPVLGQSPAFLKAEVDKDEKIKAELEDIAFRMYVVEHVMRRVNIRVLE